LGCQPLRPTLLFSHPSPGLAMAKFSFWKTDLYQGAKDSFFKNPFNTFLLGLQQCRLEENIGVMRQTVYQ